MLAKIILLLLLASGIIVRGSQDLDWLDRKCVKEKLWLLGDICWGNRVRETLREHDLPVDMNYINNEFIGPMKKDLTVISALPTSNGIGELIDVFVSSYLNGRTARRRVHDFFPDLDDKQSRSTGLRAADQLLAMMLDNFHRHNPMARCCHGCIPFI